VKAIANPTTSAPLPERAANKVLQEVEWSTDREVGAFETYAEGRAAMETCGPRP
jgi:hypothetical protein